MNLQEKIQVIENDVTQAKRGIERIVDRYPIAISVLVRGNKTGLSVSVDKEFDKVPDATFNQKPLSQP